MLERSRDSMKTTSYLTGVLVFLVGALTGLFGAFRIGGALLIHDHATVIVRQELCGPLGGITEHGLCSLQADVSHTLLSGNPVLRLTDGRIVEIQSGDIKGYSFTDSRYSMGW